MIQFRDTQLDGGLPVGRQATKTDLIDMARALGSAARDDMGVAQIRALIVAALPGVKLYTGRQVSKYGFLGLGEALGLSVSKRQSAEELRAWIRQALVARAEAVAAAEKPAPYTAEELAAMPQAEELPPPRRVRALEGASRQSDD